MNPVNRQHQITFALRRLMDQLKEAPELQQAAQEANLPQKAAAVLPAPDVAPPPPGPMKQLADDMVTQAFARTPTQSPLQIAARLRNGQLVTSADLNHLLYTDPEATSLINTYQSALDRDTITPELQDRLAAKLETFGHSAPAQIPQPQQPFSLLDRRVANAQTRLDRAGDLTQLGPIDPQNSAIDSQNSSIDSAFDPVVSAASRLSGYAEGGAVAGDSDNSLAKLSALLNRYGGPHAQRLGVGVAKQFYGLDAQGNPVLGGQVGEHPVRPALLDELAALPANLIPRANALGGQSPPDVQARQTAAGVSDEIPVPQWSQDAAARLAALEKRVQETTGVGEAHSLPEHLEDAAAAFATPLPSAKAAEEVPALRRLLEMVAPVRPSTAARYATDTALVGGVNTALDALTRKLSTKPSPGMVDPEFEQAAMEHTNAPQSFAAGGHVQDARIGWEGMGYVQPKEGDNKEDAEQCGSCIHFLLKIGRCYIMRAQDAVNAKASCNYYAPGKPRTEGKPSGALTPKETGYVDRPVQCRRCRFFDPTTEAKVHCDLFTQLNRLLPHIFKLNRYVSRYGCCDFNTPGKRDPKVFGPHGPLGENKEPT